MCLFPRKILDFNSPAYKAGLRSYDCGVCPECLAKKARPWALRATYEARTAPSMMICLTYSQEIKDRKGRVIGERDPEGLTVDKRDCQLFLKRLRKYFKDVTIKYILAAEYGKRTHRPHYHALIFGACFTDIIYHKRSDRGNIIYKSPTLTKIWGHGICTVDALCASAQVARYCTKYAVKDGRADGTFMLFSRNIGQIGLLKDFNGISYVIDGRHYPIPRTIWRDVICEKYDIDKPRYRALSWCLEHFDIPYKKYVYPSANVVVHYNVAFDVYRDFKLTRDIYGCFRDADSQYKAYIAYWKEVAERVEADRPNEVERILALKNDKYFVYKQKALRWYLEKRNGFVTQVPRSNAGWRRLFTFYNQTIPRYFLDDDEKVKHFYELKSHLPKNPCHLTANDTTFSALTTFADENGCFTDAQVAYFYKIPPREVETV